MCQLTIKCLIVFRFMIVCHHVTGSSHTQSGCVLWRAPDLAAAKPGCRGTFGGRWGPRPKLALAWGTAEGVLRGPWWPRGAPDRVQHPPQPLGCWPRYLPNPSCSKALQRAAGDTMSLSQERLMRKYSDSLQPDFKRRKACEAQS